MTQNTTTGLEIAIIGMSGRFPGANDLKQFWENIKNGVDSISHFSEEELREEGISDILLKNPNFVPAKGFLEEGEYFDSQFFGYTHQEAKFMDPQVRLFHECAWEALEDAGYNPDSYKKKIGLYAGATPNLFWQNITMGYAYESIGSFAAVSLSFKDYLTTRVSYKLNLKGPSFTLFTACSTSMVAMDLACKALLTGDCSIALAGGVSLLLPKKNGYLYQEGYIRSKDGKCRSFDAQASGTVFSDGIGVVTLKRLQDAVDDRDNIYAVVKGISMNNDGSNKTGYTAPSISGQTEVIKKAHYFSEVAPETISFIETHGTATQLGDPIEIESLKLVYDKMEKGSCAIGTVKTNIGHLDCASGVAGIIKTALSLQNKIIPPSLHFETPNPKIDFEKSPFFVNTENRSWERKNNIPRRAGVSSFGVGGTNVFAILEEYETSISPFETSKPQLFLLSAKSVNALNKHTQNIQNFLKGNESVNLSDVAYTLQVGRKHFNFRRPVIASNREEAIQKLGDWEESWFNQVKESHDATIFLFPGQGAQYFKMGADLYKTEPFFKKQMDECFEILETISGKNYKEILFGGAEEELPHLVNETSITQPLLFAFEYSLAQLLLFWGIKPDIMIGHSVGEYTAACLAEVFTLKDALLIISTRGELMQKVEKGSMLSVAVSEEELTYLLEEETLDLAAVNSPKQCVVAGRSEEIKRFSEFLTSKEISNVILHTSHAFHSRMMDHILDEFERAFEKIELKSPKTPIISNLTSQILKDEEAVSPRYWRKHLRNAVRFSDGLNALSEYSNPIFIEIGPGRTLSSFVRQNSSVKSDKLINTIRHPNEKQDDHYYLVEKLGKLWSYGVDINWENFNNSEKPYRVSLPTYPFERKKYEIDQRQKDYLSLQYLNLYGEFSIFDPEVNNASKRAKDVNNWFYIPSFKKIASCRQQPGKKCYCLISGPSEGNKWLKAKLEEEGHSVYEIKLSDEYERESSENTIAINPLIESNFDDLLNNIETEYPITFVHTLSLEPIFDISSTSVDNELNKGLYLLMNLSKALGRLQGEGKNYHIEVVTNRCFKLLDEDIINPFNSILTGAVKVIPKEFANIKCKLIDLDFTSEGKGAIEAVSTELGEYKHDIVCLRRGSRWVPSYEETVLEGRPDSMAIRKNGVYLITGGMGGIGATIARHFAQNFRAKLVITGRASLPSKDQWRNTEGHEDSLNEKIAYLQSLEEAGAEVLYIQADAADFDGMQHVFDEAKERFGTINGVIHCAGIADEAGIVQRRTAADTAKVLDPKVKGTLIISELTKDLHLDMLVLCSSISAITAPMGEIGYVSANSFLDGFAAYNRLANKVRTISINWGAWKDVGMAVKSVARLGLNSSILKDEIPSEDGLRAFERIIAEDYDQVIVSPKNLNITLKENGKKTILKSSSSKGEQRPDLNVDYLAPDNQIEQQLTEMWRNILGIEKVGVNDNFFDLGANSIDLVQLNNMLLKEYNKNIPVVKLYEYTTIKKLADFIDQGGQVAVADIAQGTIIEGERENKLRQRKSRVTNLD